MSEPEEQKKEDCMAVDNSTIVPVACVRDLGVQLDQHLNMDQQVTAVCKACNY